MKVESFIEIVVGMIALVSFVYRFSQLESKIYKSIDIIEDKFSEKFNFLENKFGIHLSNYIAKNEMQDYQIHALGENLEHKFKRCWEELKAKR